MAANTPITSEERTRIVDLLQEHGGNRNKVARIVGRAPSCVQKVAREEGIQSENIREMKKAREARAAFREIDRMEIIQAGLKKGGELLDKVKGSRDYKDVMTGIAIGIDKHRLETGDVTDRTESRRTKPLPDFFKEVEVEAFAGWEASRGDPD